MAGGGTGVVGGTRELDQTPTWAVASVVAVIILISILLEKVLHHFSHFFQKKKKKALHEALMKIEGELMVLGFISLLLVFTQTYISSLCIPMDLAETMLPCPSRVGLDHGNDHSGSGKGGGSAAAAGHRRRLLYYDRRFLAADTGKGCKAGKVPLISLHGLHQLHIFIFFLAVFHVAYSCITMGLGRLKIRGWKEWEREAEKTESDDNDSSRFRLTHETSFVKNHTSSFWTKNPVLFYIGCFFRQFFRSVRKADYLTMRHGFIAVHLAPGTKFDFQKYIKRSLEDDFKVVVGIPPLLWAAVVTFLLMNVHGWQSMFWESIVPLLLILSVGTKLQGIITQMALDIQEKHAVVQGIPLVQVSDKHFWFSWPQLVLYIIHFCLFQNAFELTYFFWIWYEFGLRSCFHDNFLLIITRVGIGAVLLFVCSYITLPLYALVTQAVIWFLHTNCSWWHDSAEQMGSNMKKSVFDEQTNKALKKWHMNAQKKKEGKAGGQNPNSGGSVGDTTEATHVSL